MTVAEHPMDAWALTRGVHTLGGFRYLGVFGDKGVFFGTLEEHRLTLDQARGFAEPFHCGLLAPKTLEGEELSGLFAALVACGCRGIAIFGPDAERFKQQFDGILCGTFHQGLNGGEVWSTAHDRLVDAGAALATAAGASNVYLIELGFPEFEEACFHLVRGWD